MIRLLFSPLSDEKRSLNAILSLANYYSNDCLLDIQDQCSPDLDLIELVRCVCVYDGAG